MTLKQRKFVKVYAGNGGDGQAAAIAAGYSPKSAKSIASELLNSKTNLNVQAALWQLMDKKGLTDTHLLEPIKAGLIADKVISARVIVKSDDPTVKLEAAHSRTDDFIEVPDHPTRLKAAELGFKLKGYLKPEGDTGPKSVTLVYGHNVAMQTFVKATLPSDAPNGQ